MAIDRMMAAAPDHGGNRKSDTGHRLVPFSFDKEAMHHIMELKRWEQRSETVELELVGRR